MDRLAEIQARLAAINTEMDSAEGDAFTALETEARNLMTEMEGIKNIIEARKKLRDDIARGAGNPMPGAAPAAQKSDEQRAADAFAQTNRMTIGAEQARALTVASGQLVQPTKVDGINELPGVQVSSIIDLIKVVNCTGMGNHKIAYVKETAPAAGEHTEGEAAATATLAQFGFVTISPTSYAVLDFITQQAKKQTTLQYASKVREQAMAALRRKAVEVVTAALRNSTLLQTVAGAAIDAKTLRSISLNYGNDESVLGGAMLLLLNKKDLLKFGDVRGTNEKKALYEIIPDGNGNTGTIREGGLTVRYCIDSHIPEGELYYGNPQALELDLFSDYEVKVSEDFAFDKLMDTIRGDVEMGSDVVVKNGWLKYTTGA